MESSSRLKKIYTQSEVYIHTMLDAVSEINGHLELIQDSSDCVFIAWAPSYSIPGIDSSVSIGSEQYSIKVPVQDILSIQKHISRSSPPFIAINTKGSSSPITFYFHASESGIDALVKYLFDFLPLVQSENDSNLFVVAQESKIIEKVLSTDPIDSTASGIGWFEILHSVYRITSQIATTTSQSVTRTGTENKQYIPILQSKKHEATSSSLQVSGDDEFEVVQRSDAPDIHSVPPLRFDIKRTGQIKTHKKVSVEFWNSLLDSEGRIDSKKEHAVRKLIFFGGIEDSARILVWPYITGLYPFGSTYKQRELILAENKKLYQSLILQWSNISSLQEENFTPYKDRKTQIEKDVVRTDRQHPLFLSDESPQLKQLHNILLSYSFFNWDLGYVQGMNDLLSPMLCILQDEELAFGCFISDMRNTARNFRQDQKGIHEQFEQLRNLLKYLDPSLYLYLEKNDSVNMFFMYRWILVRFKREFSHDDINRLWESLWSRHKGDNFHLFIAVGILLRQRDIIMKEKLKFDDMLRHIHQLGNSMVVPDVIEDGLFLHSFIEKEGTPQLKGLL